VAIFALIWGVALMHLLVISSPGPTFVVVSRYAIAGDRRSGLLVAVGVVLATLTWSSFAAMGLGTVATRFPLAFAVIQYSGAAYLIYLGVKLIAALVREHPGGTARTRQSAPRGGWHAVRAGYITNMSNPKVIAYYTSLFGVMLPANPSIGQFLLIVATVVTISAAWWSGIACFFTIERVRQWFARSRRWIDGVMGVLLVGFGIRLFVSR
jgi:threonine efflux protein